MPRIAGWLNNGAIAALAIAMTAGAAHAQTAPQAADENEVQSQDEIVVSGIRQSVVGSIARKKNAAQLVDSIVADDIGKLPDLTAVDALQRVPGVSITRDRGEGGGARIRGLGQVLSTIDGRESFTADGGRGYNLEDMPAELLGGIDVYKTPTAEQIEGGISGSIDLRTRMPFDFAKTTFSGSIRARYADLADKVSPIYSGLFSTRWDTGIGEMGFLITAVNQYRTFRSDNPGWGGALGRTDLIPGQKTYLSLGDYEPLIYGKRHRPGVNAAFQWKPAHNLEIYAQFGYQKFTSYQQQYGFNAPLPNSNGNTATNQNTVVPGSVTLFDGTNNVRRATFNNLSGAYTFGVERDTKDQNSQYATGFKWSQDNNELKVDVSYMKSSNHLWYTELDLKFVPPQTTFDYSGLYPQTTFSGIDLGSLGSYTVGNLSMNVNNYKGDELAIRADDRIALGDGFLTALKLGGRVNRRSLQFYDVVRFNRASINTNPATAADLFEAMPFDDYVSEDANVPRGYLVANPDFLQHDNFDNMRGLLGITNPVTFSPQSPYHIKETAKAGYAMLEFANDSGIRFDGNVGVRYVRTDIITDSFKTAAGVITPYHQEAGYEDWLPSANLRFKFTDDFFLRLAYSKTLTRPGTQQLSPSLTLVPASGTGSGGNPNLKPLRSTGFDASLEKYFGTTGSLYLAAFDRRVKDFIFTSTVTGVVIDGVTYTISSPVNGRYGHTRGFEIGANTFFDFLPGALSGFGAQGNFTYIDSDTDQVIPGSRTRLPGVPTKQLAASLLYEKSGLGARLSYTWRNTAFSGIYTFNYPTTPTPTPETGQSYALGYGWLDGSLSYDFNKHITASVEFSNITGTNIRNSRGAYRPTDYSVDDRQILFGVRFKY